MVFVIVRKERWECWDE